MEAGQPGLIQSGRTSTSNNPHPDYYDRRPREAPERPYGEGAPAMATATLISPSTPYHPHHSPFSANYPPHPSQSAHVAAMVSPVEPPRRTSDDADSGHRQLLPSIREVIGHKPSLSGPAPTAATTGPPGTQSLPSPFSQGLPSRPFAEPHVPTPAPQEKHASPRALHPPPASAFPRPEPLPAFSDPPRSSVSRPGPPPLSIFSGHPPQHHPQTQHPHPHQPPHQQSHAHHSPSSIKPEPHEVEQHRHPVPESAHMNGHYTLHSPHPHHHPPGPPGPYSHAPMQLPPGQLPLSGYPMSPRHSVPAPLPSPFDTSRPPLGPEEADYARNRGKYDGPAGRHYDPCSYAEQLARIGSTARTILNFTEMYSKLAQEEHGHPLPGRTPTEAELSEVISNMDWVRGMLDNMRAFAKQAEMNERAREGSRPRMGGYPEDEDVTMYNDGTKPNFAVSEVKKRRGRAAPPGRCHSCNRIDTPEWRRGPDGARTLCNACGLHYAKLERKRQAEAKNIRPKPSEDRN